MLDQDKNLGQVVEDMSSNNNSKVQVDMVFFVFFEEDFVGVKKVNKIDF